MNLEKILASHALWLAGKGGERADLRDAYVQETDFRGANLQEVDFRGACLSDTNFQWANLQGADLQEVCLYGANLREAILQGANLRGAELEFADFRGTNLSGADLREARLWHVVGNDREVRSLHCIDYPIVYTASHLQIEREKHVIEDWWEFSDGEIDDIDPEGFLDWWEAWKPMLQQLIKRSPAVPTGMEGKE
jgi:hypothetical protein